MRKKTKISSDHIISNQSSQTLSPFKLRSGKIQWEPSLSVESLLRETDQNLSLLDKVETFYQSPNMPNLKCKPPGHAAQEQTKSSFDTPNSRVQ